MCDRGLHRYLRNFGVGLNTPTPPPRYATAPHHSRIFFPWPLYSTLKGTPFGTWQLIVWLHKLNLHSILSELSKYLLTHAHISLSFTSHSQWTASICFSNLQPWLKGDPPHEFLHVAEMYERRERGGWSRADLEVGLACWWECRGTQDGSPVPDITQHCISKHSQSANVRYRSVDSCPQLSTPCVWNTTSSLGP